jgi:hypothetical protein
MLRETPSITVLDVVSGNWPAVYEQEIYWDSSGSAGGVVRSDGNPAVVTNISVGQDGSLTLQDVIDAYGQPSHVVARASPCVDQKCVVYRLVVLYLRHGFALSLDERMSKPELSPDWNDLSVWFFEPTLHGFAVAWGNPAVADAVTPWRGMLGFDAYCTGEACNEGP